MYWFITLGRERYRYGESKQIYCLRTKQRDRSVSMEDENAHKVAWAVHVSRQVPRHLELPGIFENVDVLKITLE